MHYGYARVSSTDQETSLQRDALRRAGVRQIYEEKRSALKQRPQLEALVSVLRPGDVVMVYKLDRLARSVRDLIGIFDRLTAAGASLRSLTEPMDTSSAAGQLMLHMLAAFAQFEWSMIRERSMAGQQAARERGARIGRPRSIDERGAQRLQELVDDGHSISAAARRVGVHLSSAKRAIRRARSGGSRSGGSRSGGSQSGGS